LESWLKSGIISDNHFCETSIGVPQGGVISPLISNFVLDGLEVEILSSFTSITKSKNLVREYVASSGKPKIKRLNVHFVRYADDFIVMCCSKHLARKYIRPVITKFLFKRGLIINNEKSSLFCLKNKPLKFLGYEFIYKKKWRSGKSIFKGKGFQSGVAMVPQKEKFVSICKKVRRIICGSTHKAAYNVIAQVNPVIQGWCEYFR